MDFKVHFREILMGRIGSNIIAVASIGMLLATGAAYAQTARSGGGASAQLLQQMQQLASERTSLQAENAKLKKDLEDMRKDRDSLKSAQQTVDRRVKSSEIALKESAAQRASTDQELAQTKQKIQQLIDKFKETLLAMRDVETERTTVKQTLATRDQDLKMCVDHNLALYKLNQEVLTRLEHHSVWTRVAETEPFTRIKRSQLENLVDDYKDRADVQRIDPSRAAGSSAPPGAPSQAPPAPPPPQPTSPPIATSAPAQAPQH
jgi:chromosome segregation ATPase